jgi:hypothetical protein
VPALRAGAGSAVNAAKAAGATLLATLAFAATLVAPSRTHALPDGAPWEVALDQGCPQCHFDAPAVQDSSALEIDGLPQRVAPGARYALVVRMRDADMRNAGFLLSAWQEDAPAGRFAAVDERAAVNAAQARSTAAGALVDEGGVVEWALEWTAPQSTEPLRFELWANAGNDDASPLGDATHRRTWRVPPSEPRPTEPSATAPSAAEKP